jgi:hypothetical protein
MFGKGPSPQGVRLAPPFRIAAPTSRLAPSQIDQTASPSLPCQRPGLVRREDCRPKGPLGVVGSNCPARRCLRESGRVEVSRTAVAQAEYAVPDEETAWRTEPIGSLR